MVNHSLEYMLEVGCKDIRSRNHAGKLNDREGLARQMIEVYSVHHFESIQLDWRADTQHQLTRIGRSRYNAKST